MVAHEHRVRRANTPFNGEKNAQGYYGWGVGERGCSNFGSVPHITVSPQPWTTSAASRLAPQRQRAGPPSQREQRQWQPEQPPSLSTTHRGKKSRMRPRGTPGATRLAGCASNKHKVSPPQAGPGGPHAVPLLPQHQPSLERPPAPCACAEHKAEDGGEMTGAEQNSAHTHAFKAEKRPSAHFHLIGTAACLQLVLG